MPPRPVSSGKPTVSKPAPKKRQRNDALIIAAGNSADPDNGPEPRARRLAAIKCDSDRRLANDEYSRSKAGSTKKSGESADPGGCMGGVKRKQALKRKNEAELRRKKRNDKQKELNLAKRAGPRDAALAAFESTPIHEPADLVDAQQFMGVSLRAATEMFWQLSGYRYAQNLRQFSNDAQEEQEDKLVADIIAEQPTQEDIERISNDYNKTNSPDALLEFCGSCGEAQYSDRLLCQVVPIGIQQIRDCYLLPADDARIKNHRSDGYYYASLVRGLARQNEGRLTLKEARDLVYDLKRTSNDQFQWMAEEDAKINGSSREVFMLYPDLLLFVGEGGCTPEDPCACELLSVCNECRSALANFEIPPFSMANSACDLGFPKYWDLGITRAVSRGEITAVSRISTWHLAGPLPRLVGYHAF